MDITDKEVETIIENSQPVLVNNGVGVHPIREPVEDADKIRELIVEDTPIEYCEVTNCIYFDSENGFWAVAPYAVIPDAPPGIGIAAVAALFRARQDVAPSSPERMEEVVALLEKAIPDGPQGDRRLLQTDIPEENVDFSDEEIRGLAQTLVDEEALGNEAVIIDEHGVRSLGELPQSAEEVARAVRQQLIPQAERQSVPFTVQFRNSFRDEKASYMAYSGDGYTLLFPVEGIRELGDEAEVTSRRIVEDYPLFVTVHDLDMSRATVLGG